MQKSSTSNTFQGGLVMDLDPLQQDNNTLTNCLNGTLITFNGNENALQNDMGNGRVETAYLPEGYIPLGSCSYGGIIYVVSYNPLIDKCQIGSFPSPERNITSDECSKMNVSLKNSDFQKEETGDLTAYVKTLSLLEGITFSPGDQFKIYADNIPNRKSQYLSDNYTISCMGDYLSGNHIGYLTLKPAIQSSSGTITYITDLKKYAIEQGSSEFYYMSKASEGTFKDDVKKDLDSYRNLISSAYNTIPGNLSGELVLVVQLEYISGFNVSCTAKQLQNKDVEVSFNVTQQSSDKNIHLGYILLNNSSSGVTYNTLSDGDWHYSYDNKYWESSESPFSNTVTIQGPTFKNATTGTYTWEITPAMYYGKLPLYTQSGIIDFSLLGSGQFKITKWRYYKNNNNVRLDWGINWYPLNGISDAEFEISFYKVTQKDILEKSNYTIQSTLTPSEIINLQGSPLISFTELDENSLYLARFQITYSIDGKITYLKDYRWIYTNGQWNNKYSSVIDFNNLTLEEVVKLTIATNNVKKQSSTSQDIEYNKKLNNLTSQHTSEELIASIIDNIEYTDSEIFSLQLLVNNSTDTSPFNLDIPDGTFQVTSQDTVCKLSDSTLSITNTPSIEQSTEIGKYDKFQQVDFKIKGTIKTPVKLTEQKQSNITYNYIFKPLLYDTKDAQTLGFVPSEVNMKVVPRLSSSDKGSGDGVGFIIEGGSYSLSTNKFSESSKTGYSDYMGGDGKHSSNEQMRTWDSSVDSNVLKSFEEINKFLDGSLEDTDIKNPLLKGLNFGVMCFGSWDNGIVYHNAWRESLNKSFYNYNTYDNSPNCRGVIVVKNHSDKSSWIPVPPLYENILEDSKDQGTLAKCIQQLACFFVQLYAYNKSDDQTIEGYRITNVEQISYTENIIVSYKITCLFNTNARWAIKISGHTLSEIQSIAKTISTDEINMNNVTWDGSYPTQDFSIEISLPIKTDIELWRGLLNPTLTLVKSNDGTIILSIADSIKSNKVYTYIDETISELQAPTNKLNSGSAVYENGSVKYNDGLFLYEKASSPIICHPLIFKYLEYNQDDDGKYSLQVVNAGTQYKGAPNQLLANGLYASSYRYLKPKSDWYSISGTQNISVPDLWYFGNGTKNNNWRSADSEGAKVWYGLPFALFQGCDSEYITHLQQFNKS